MPENETEPGAIVPSGVPKPVGVRFIFAGPEGLRAGWRLLIFIALLATLFTVTGFLLRPLAGKLGTAFTVTTVVISEALLFGIVLIASLIMARFERRSFADYGLPFRLALRKQFWTGALWGFVMLSIIIALMMATHAYTFGAIALSPSGILKYGLGWALGFLLVGLFEEFTARGYLQFTLTTGMGFWPAAVVTSSLFAAGHIRNPGENWVGVVEIVLIAVFLCVALRRTGNLWFAIGWHMAFDWGESFFYSTPNSGIHAVGHLFNASLLGPKWLSGGTVGPEASVFDVIVTVAGILLLAKLYPEAKYPASPAIDAGKTDADKIQVSS
jgi:membrane protease YdiL (CAAX protease family)